MAWGGGGGGGGGMDEITANKSFAKQGLVY